MEQESKSAEQFTVVSSGKKRKTILICCPLLCLWSILILIIGLGVGIFGSFIFLTNCNSPTLSTTYFSSSSPTLTPTVTPTSNPTYEQYEPEYTVTIP
tara:strand:+ start:547 stop:840 length:294 start_codon:yes stop_codon:yes gene_type:complete